MQQYEQQQQQQPMQQYMQQHYSVQSTDLAKYYDSLSPSSPQQQQQQQQQSTTQLDSNNIDTANQYADNYMQQQQHFANTYANKYYTDYQAYNPAVANMSEASNNIFAGNNSYSTSSASSSFSDAAAYYQNVAPQYATNNPYAYNNNFYNILLQQQQQQQQQPNQQSNPGSMQMGSYGAYSNPTNIYQSCSKPSTPAASLAAPCQSESTPEKPVMNDSGIDTHSPQLTNNASLTSNSGSSLLTDSSSAAGTATSSPTLGSIDYYAAAIGHNVNSAESSLTAGCSGKQPAFLASVNKSHVYSQQQPAPFSGHATQAQQSESRSSIPNVQEGNNGISSNGGVVYNSTVQSQNHGNTVTTELENSVTDSDERDEDQSDNEEEEDDDNTKENNKPKQNNSNNNSKNVSKNASNKKCQSKQQQQQQQQQDSKLSPSKPPKPYLEIIADAILSCSVKMMQLHEIYHFMESKYQYFARNINKSWRNSVRHNLSLNECFVKAGRGTNGKGHYWRIHPLCEKEFIRGNFRRKSFKQLIRAGQQAAAAAAAVQQHAGGAPLSFALPFDYPMQNYKNIPPPQQFTNGAYSYPFFANSNLDANGKQQLSAQQSHLQQQQPPMQQHTAILNLHNAAYSSMLGTEQISQRAASKSSSSTHRYQPY